jgi:hypothetical protein
MAYLAVTAGCKMQLLLVQCIIVKMWLLKANKYIGNGEIYWKWSNTNTSADWKVAADKAYVDTIASGLSWRDPVVVLDDTLYADSSAFPTSGTVDGVVLVDGERVLFTNVTNTIQQNVWIYQAGSPGSWIEDPKQETDGDALFVQEGTWANTQWVYDGATWVQFGASIDPAELVYIRAFIGKSSAGSEDPSYSSAVYITQSASLETTIGELDAALNDEVIDLQTQITANGTAIGTRTYSQENFVTDGQTITASIDALDVALEPIFEQGRTLTASNVDASATITVDTLPLTAATQVEWMIQVRSTSTPANKEAMIVHALSDGVEVDYVEYGILTSALGISGFTHSVDINAGNIRLRITASENVDYVVKRLGFSTL